MSLTLVYDGGCPFCRHFALRSELTGGIPELEIRDGRAEQALRQELRRRGMNLADGAVLLEGEQAWHGSAAIAELTRRMRPGDPLLQLLRSLFRDDARSLLLYTGLLLARRLSLIARGLPEDPDEGLI